MRICFVIGSLSYSGAEKIMCYLIDSFKIKNDVSVILMAEDAEYDFLQGVKQYPIYDKNEVNEGRIYRTLKREKIIRNIVEKERFDIIVSFGVIYNIDLIEACRNCKSKIILCERNDPYNDPHSKLLRIRRALSYPFADGFVFQTADIMNFFSKKIQKRSVVIPNFIERKINLNDGYNPNRLAFATSARLDNRQKDQITLLRAFANFHSRHEEYTLEFYGDGPDRKLLEDEAKRLGIGSAVVFKGRVKNPMEYIRTAKAFVLTSNYEGMPNALIEAMAHGMPCISSDCSGGGARALINDGVNGLIFPVGDVKALEDTFEKVIDNEFAEKIGCEAYKINDRLEITKIISIWEKYIKSVITK